MKYDLHLGDCLEFMRSMPDRSVDAVITDPPYGVDYEGGAVNEIKREKLSGDHNADLYAKSIPEIFRILKDGGTAYIFYATSCSHEVYPVIHSVFKHYQQLIWHKTNATFGSPNARYHFDYEPLIYCRKGSPSTWNGGSKQRAVLRYKREAENIYHPTQKPTSLMRVLLTNSTNEGDTVFDPFMGSGTTGLASQQSGRNFIGCEIDPNYYAIAERRIKQAAMQEVMFT